MKGELKNKRRHCNAVTEVKKISFVENGKSFVKYCRLNILSLVRKIKLY